MLKCTKLNFAYRLMIGLKFKFVSLLLFKLQNKNKEMHKYFRSLLIILLQTNNKQFIYFLSSLKQLIELSNKNTSFRPEPLIV